MQLSIDRIFPFHAKYTKAFGGDATLLLNDICVVTAVWQNGIYKISRFVTEFTITDETDDEIYEHAKLLCEVTRMEYPELEFYFTTHIRAGRFVEGWYLHICKQTRKLTHHETAIYESYSEWMYQCEQISTYIEINKHELARTNTLEYIYDITHNIPILINNRLNYYN